MTLRTLVIGGRSRVAIALRKLRPGAYDYVVRGDARGNESKVRGGVDHLVVESYADLTAGDMSGYETVINLVGTTDGTTENLMAVNAGLSRHVSCIAFTAGVRHFIALSSFSVYGSATRINRSTPVAPVSAYGRSRVAGEAAIANHADGIKGDNAGDMSCTFARCPMLYGAGSSKLERLVAFWGRFGLLPVPTTPVHRSMVHYDLAARYLDERAQSGPTKPGLNIELFADPVTFEYRAAASILSEATQRKHRVFPLPSGLVCAVSAVAPQLSRSLFESSELDAGDNFFKDPEVSRLERDLADMASQRNSFS